MALTNVLADMQSLMKNVAQLNMKVGMAANEISEKVTTAEKKAHEVQESLAKAAAKQAKQVAHEHSIALSQCRSAHETKFSDEHARSKGLMAKQSAAHADELSKEKGKYEAQLESNATEAQKTAVAVAQEFNAAQATAIKAVAQVF
jgi:hypothetical protein